MTPSELTEMLGIPAATLSFHLKELTQAGLITQTRQGRHMLYQPGFQAISELIGFLTSNCCEGQGCSLSELVQQIPTKKPS